MSGDIVVVGISLGITPGCGVSIDGGATEVEDSHVVEGEGTGRSRSRAVIGRADRPYIAGEKSWEHDFNTQSRIQWMTQSPIQWLVQNRILPLRKGKLDRKLDPMHTSKIFQFSKP